MNILIADDERPARSELRHILEEVLDHPSVVEADCGEAAVEAMAQGKFDVLFLDINLGDMPGTAVASAARQLQPGVPIIFATAYCEHAVRAFELGASDYVLKPFDLERIRLTMDRLSNRQGLTAPVREVDKLAVSIEKKIVLIPVSDVGYIETHGRGCRLHTRSSIYEDTSSIGSFEQRLSGRGFFRIHKSYLVNLNLIEALFPWHGSGFALTLTGFGQVVLPIARGQLKALREYVGC